MLKSPAIARDFLVNTPTNHRPMNIQLNRVIPTPLRDKLSLRSSDIWNQELNFAAGEWIKIKAPSGTGKTTLIHSIYGLRNDYAGEIMWDSKSVQQLDAELLAVYRQLKISVIFQDLRLFPGLSAWENIELKRLLQAPFHNSDHILHMAEELGVTHILQQKAGICSYGEQQRIAIIRALSQPFEWLIMDEPFSHLDERNAEKAVSLITAECKRRNAGLLITDLHDDQYFTYHRTLSL